MNRINGMTFAEAKAHIAKGRDKHSRPVANNTRLIDRGDRIALQLHATDVVTLHEDGTIEFDSGGWATVTTKDRMCYADGFRVWSDRGVWLIGRHGRKTYLYEDGIRFTPRGRAVNGKVPQSKAGAAKVKREEKLRRQIRDFAVKAVQTLDVEGGIPATNLGDCFFCQMHDASEPKERERHGYNYLSRDLGTVTGNTEHLLSHIEEDYIPTALITNAMREYPMSHLGQSMMIGAHEGPDGEIRIGGFRENGWGDRRRHSADTVATAVYRYMMRRLLPNREARGNFSQTNIPVVERTAA